MGRGRAGGGPRAGVHPAGACGEEGEGRQPVGVSIDVSGNRKVVILPAY